MQSAAFAENLCLLNKNSLLWHVYTLPPLSVSLVSVFSHQSAAVLMCSSKTLAGLVHSSFLAAFFHPTTGESSKGWQAAWPRVECKVRQTIKRTRKATPLLSEACIVDNLWRNLKSKKPWRCEIPGAFLLSQCHDFLDGREKRKPKTAWAFVAYSVCQDQWPLKVSAHQTRPEPIIMHTTCQIVLQYN